MLTSEFDYHLPKELIAQVPSEKRDQSRLMILHRKTGEIEHKVFSDILDYLKPNDVLVVNDSKVYPARLYGTSQKTGGAVEVLLVKRLSENRWSAMTSPGKRTRPTAKLSFGNGKLTAEILSTFEDGNREIQFQYDGTWESVIAELGMMPVPPYIKRSPEMRDILDLDKTRYQTVYAQVEGSIAAPTAGLHFTPELLEKIKHKGVDVAKVTLHVGTGTFLPVKTEKIENHPMHSEWFTMSSETAGQIQTARAKEGRVIAVGTTACRVLESLSNSVGALLACTGETDIFIYPGYQFKIVDGLITNFHLPKSTLIMLVSAFAGKENIMNAYREAVEQKYRFYSYGDAMLIV